MLDQIRPVKHMAEDLELYYTKLEELIGYINTDNTGEAIDLITWSKNKLEPMKAMSQVLAMYNRLIMLQNLIEEKPVNEMELAKMIRGAVEEELDEFSKLSSNLAEKYCFDDNAKLTEIKDDGKHIGFQFQFLNSNYTAQPISALQSIELTVNSHEVEPEDIFIIIRGQRIRAIDAPSIHELWWNHGERILIYIDKPLYWFGFNQTEYEVKMNMKARTIINYGIPDGLLKTIITKKMEVI